MMGTDIHVHTEVKFGGRWHHYGAPKVSRNYRLFTKMRGNSTTSFATRGRRPILVTSRMCASSSGSTADRRK